MKEKWKPVVGWPGYQVSNLGRVMSQICVLKPGIDTHGYRYVVLCPGQKNKLIGRLVLEAFKGLSDLQVDHKDRVRTNDKLSNLRWATPAQNCQNRRTPVRNKL